MKAWEKLAVAGAFVLGLLVWGDCAWASVKIEKHIAPLQGMHDRQTTGTAYADLGESYKVIINWDATKYSSPTVYFEAVLASNNASGTAYAKLQEHGSATEVSGSEVSVTGTTYTRVRSSAITLTDGTQYKVITKSDNSSYTATLRASRIVIVQDASSISATETHLYLSPYALGPSSASEPVYDQRFYYNSAEWDGTVTIFFEATIRSSSVGKLATAQLWDFTSNTAVSGGSVNNSGITLNRGSTTVSLTSGHYYGVKVNGGSGYNAYMSNAKLIFQQSGTITKTQTHIPVLYNGVQPNSSSYSDFNYPVQFNPANWSGVSNTYFHQVSSKTSGEVTNIMFTQLYDSTGSAALDERRWSGSNTWTLLSPSSPVVMPTSAATITARLKHPGTTAGYTVNRLIIQTYIGTTAKIQKEVHLNPSEAVAVTGTTWGEGSGVYQNPFKWEPSNYTNPKVYLEAVINTNDTANNAIAALFNTSDLINPIAESQVFSRSGSYERLRSGNLAGSLTDGQSYVVQIKSSGAGVTTTMNTCRLVIYQEDATITNTETHVFLNGFDAVNGSSYVETYYPNYFYYDSSKFDGTVTVYFEAFMQPISGVTVYAQLYQVGGAAVSGSEVSSADDTKFVRVRSGAITLTSGNQYGIKMKTNNAGGSCQLMGAKLIIQQSGSPLTKTESHFQLAHDDNMGGGGYTDTSYTAQSLYNLYEPNNWSFGTPAFFHETTFKTTSIVRTAYVELYNSDDSSSVSERSTTSTTWTRSRSFQLTRPTTAKTMEMRGKVDSGGTLHVSGNRFIIQSTFYSATAVKLISFTAAGAGAAVQVSWTTAQESDNKGFDLYRATSASGPFVKLNGSLIPSGSVSSEGRDYEFMDTAVSRGATYYYRLEDVDVSGAVTLHGPVCVDWDGDGLPDDWEIAQGLNPAVNDAALDSDGDGASNLLEYQRGTDPLNPDTDGDGIADGLERKAPHAAEGRSDFGEGVQVVSVDAVGMTLELVTKNFDVTPVVAGGQAFERLRVPSYVHGFTLAAGLPQLPLKGILLDIPQGKQARVTVLDAASRTLSGYRVFPAPVYEAGANNQVAEVFSWDEAAYRENAYYPAVAAELSSEYMFRGQAQQRLIFYPLRFNPATGALLHSERIRVRVEFVEASAFAQGFGGQVRASAAAFQRPPAAVAAGEGGYKVSTGGEGIYRITRAGLQAAGIADADIDAINLAHVQLFNLGSEQAIHIYDANSNNRLDAGDYISFYATAVPSAYAKYARYNVYWLIDAGSVSPLRMASIDGAPSGAPVALSHASTVHHELDQGYLQNSPGPDGMDRWLFPAVALGPGFAGGGTAKSFTLTVSGVAGAGELALRLYSPYAMEHAASVALNNVSLGSVTWSGSGFTEGRFTGVNLLEGANTVAVTCQSGADKIYFDWFEADYERSFVSAADSLKFTHAGGFRYGISGFSTNDVELFDVSDAAAVKRVVNGTASGSGPYAIEVQPAQAANSASYLAVAASGRKTPAAIVKDRASRLADPTNAADWILITHREIGWDGSGAEQPWVASLVGLRQAQGLRTAVVDVADIFDEFGYGLVTPQAIKEFIAYAYEHWQAPAPQYVLLMGDTTYDYKDNRNLGTVNYVPGYLICTTHLGETISDDWYVQVSGSDAVPDLYIGRLPANSAAQAEAMVTKIVTYETSANTRGWEKRLVLAADNQAEEWESVFETMNEDVAACLPAGMATPERFYLQEYQNESLAVADLTGDLTAAINAGALIVNYSGHGSVNLWAGEQMLDNRGGAYRSDVGSLTNSGKYPFVVNMSCLTGYFIYPSAGGYAGSGWLSLAEGWMLPATHGAIAALMPTGMTEPDGQQVLSNALYEGIFVLDKRILGAAVAYAKQQLLANGGAAYEETGNTFMYFGDPATTLKVPLPRRPTGLTALWPASGAVTLIWEAAADCDGNAVASYNLYRRLSTEETYTRLNTAPITGLSYTDTGLSATPAGATYYYALSAVDASSEESVKSAVAGLTIADSGGGGGGGGGGCFIASTGWELSPDLLRPLGAMALLICLVWIGRRRRE